MATQRTYLALVVDGVVVKAEPSLLGTPDLTAESKGLEAFNTDFRQVLEEHAVNQVAFMLPDMTYKATYKDLGPRGASESLIRLAAESVGASYERLARPRVRTRLGIPKQGSMTAALVADVVAPVGQHWVQGRYLAALAALAAGDK